MSTKMSKFKRIFLVLLIMLSLLFLSIMLFFSIVYNKFDLDKEKLTSVNNGIKVYSADGSDNTLYNTNRSIVEIETLPNYVKQAFIDIEDKRFYDHNGYDIKRIIKSTFVNLTSKSKSQGASTISQQLIKNALLSNEKTYSRKIQEIVLSIKMEKEFTKDEILEMYLNTIYFGSNAYGIENASKTYFNKSAKDLTLNEACCLAGLIKSPNHFSPKTHPENSLKRKNLVAKNMLKNGSITENEYDLISQQDILTYSSQEIDNSYEKEAIFEACDLLNIKERDLINKKYKILTFKDDNLQNHVIKVNNSVIETSEAATNSSLDSLSVVTNNKGQVLAFYGNSNYNLHNLKRQPASTLKPFAVYLPCFKYDILSPASQILDEEINYNGFQPQNADNSFHGYVSTRHALSHSLNIPAVKALDYLGVKKAKTELANFGINLTASDLNLSLALGATKNGVKLMDLLAAYNTLSNNGIYRNLSFVDKILDEHDNVVYSHEDFDVQVCNSSDCFLVNDILKDCAKTGTARRFESLNIPIASKTGTASNLNGNTDLFNIAYTTEHSLLTWVADIDKINLPKNLYSSSQPTDINKEICSYLYANHSPFDFSQPDDIKKMPYDLAELENNHILIEPNHNIERYIAYDYFKCSNAPMKANIFNSLDFDVKLSKYGANISFIANKMQKYKIMKRSHNSLFVLYEISEQSGEFEILDNEVFSDFSIDYYITDSDGNILTKTVTIRPKDYLITQLTNEVLISKKRWAV